MMTLRHYRNRGSGLLGTFAVNYDDDDMDFEPVIPVPAALVTDELLTDLRSKRSVAHAERNLRLNALHDTLAAGRPEPEPLAEPEDLAARVVDHGGLEWALRDGLHPAPDGLGLIERRWGCLNGTMSDRDWDDLTDNRGPLRLVGGDS